MKERRCSICGKLLRTNRGMICWDCVRKHQQRRQQKQLFGMEVKKMNKEPIIDNKYMLVVMQKLLNDIKAKELDYGMNGVKVAISLDFHETLVLVNALKEKVDGTNE